MRRRSAARRFPIFHALFVSTATIVIVVASALSCSATDADAPLCRNSVYARGCP
jgi:hypothetical protein